LVKTQKRETAELREMLDRVAVRKGAVAETGQLDN
jgi:hypothetical protein